MAGASSIASQRARGLALLPSDQGSEFESREAAWTEMTQVCGNLLGSLSSSLKQNAEWQMELLDEAKKPVFRIRLVAESVG